MLLVVLEPRLHLDRRLAREVLGVLGRPVLEALVVLLLQPPLLDGEHAHLLRVRVRFRAGVRVGVRVRIRVRVRVKLRARVRVRVRG